MFLDFALLIILGIISLIITVISLIFGVVALSNNNSSKFIWVILFIIGFTGLMFSVVFSVKKVANTVSHFSEYAVEKFEIYTDSLSKLEELEQYQSKVSRPQIKLLKSYLEPTMLNNDPDEFYTYLGFNDYFRYPLKYPYSIHATNEHSEGELFNEINVINFDENDNGELFTGVNHIQKIAFDKNYLLIEQMIISKHNKDKKFFYVLYNMNNEKQEKASSLIELINLAKSKGYSGPDTLISLEDYRKLF